MTNLPTHAKPSVLVGVDDSPGSLHAMRVGADEAAMRNTDLHVLHVRPLPSSRPAGVRQADDSADTDFGRRLVAEVAQLQSERTAAGSPPVSVRTDVVQGDPTRELLAAAARSALLVLGVDTHRGPNEIVTTVGEGCTARPPCPVLIVPTPIGL